MTDAIDTSAEAVERLASRVNTVADWRCYGIAATLRALLAERDEADLTIKMHSDACENMRAKRDAALAEAKRLREALTKISQSTGCVEACPCWQRLRNKACAALAKEAET